MWYREKNLAHTAGAGPLERRCPMDLHEQVYAHLPWGPFFGVKVSTCALKSCTHYATRERV